MVLRVSSERFLEEVQTRIGNAPVYLQRRGRHTVATAAATDKNLLILAEFPLPLDEVKHHMDDQRIQHFEGGWSDQIEDGPSAEPLPFVMAVAYRSEGSRPGLWIDSDHIERTSSDVLRRMFDEFQANGEIAETTFEEFVRVSEPNVLVLSPHQLLHWADKHKD